MNGFTGPSRRRVLSWLCLFSSLLAGTALLHAKPPILSQKNGENEYLLHLPGIAGERRLDQEFVRGLRDGGYRGTLEIYDWTEQDPGIAALLARKRNEHEADLVAEKIAKLLNAHPHLKIRLIGHSGGSGIAAWALERLPEGMQVESVVFVAPALSQKYDLSKALAHVRGKAFAFTSENDSVVLGAGTSLFGTIDGVKEPAAGLQGFTMPEGADKEQYAKLVPMPYNDGYMDFGNIGNHIGAMTRLFAETVISPLVQDRDPPATRPSEPRIATTRPATRATTRPRK